MTWFKVDDKLHDHRKSRAAGKSAMGLWVLAGSWSADHLTDGFVPASVLPRWGTRGDAKKLVDAGLWHPDEQDGERGWRFHQWSTLQPTRAEKLAQRQAKADAGRAGGQASGRSRREAKSKQTASQGAGGLVEHPSRPDPSRAAAAADAHEPPPLPMPIQILRAALEAHRLNVRWDRLTTDQVNEIEDLVTRHGDNELIRVAQTQHRPDRPAAFAQAWLESWRDLDRRGQLRLVDTTAPPCPAPGHSGTVRHCAQCASEEKAAR